MLSDRSVPETTHLPFVQVTCQRRTENTRSGVVAMCHAAPGTDRDSYKIIYSGIFKTARAGRNCFDSIGRGGQIRTGDPLRPRQVRYLDGQTPPAVLNLLPFILSGVARIVRQLGACRLQFTDHSQDGRVVLVFEEKSLGSEKVELAANAGDQTQALRGGI